MCAGTGILDVGIAPAGMPVPLSIVTLADGRWRLDSWR